MLRKLQAFVMPHLNEKEEAEKEETSNESEEVLEASVDGKKDEEEGKDGKNAPSSVASAAGSEPKKDDSPPAASAAKPEDAAARWPHYPPAGGRHSMPPPHMPPHPYYGYDYSAWGHPPPPHGPPRPGDPYGRYPAASPARRTSSEGDDKDSPKKSSPGSADENKDDAAARAYEEHGYPPHMHRPPPYGPYGMPHPYGYPPPHAYYEEHHRMMAEHEAKARKRQADKEAGTDEAPTSKRAKVEENPEEPSAEEKSADGEKEKDEKSTETDTSNKEEGKPDEQVAPKETEDDGEHKAKGKEQAVDKDGKRIISPTSSIDGPHKGDESASSRSIQYKLSQSSSGSFQTGEPRPPSSSYDPYYHPPPPEGYPYGASRGSYPPPYAYHPMYGAYPPHPPPGWAGYYGEHPPSPRSAAHYRRDYPSSSHGYPPHSGRGSFESAASKSTEATGGSEGGRSSPRSSSPPEEKPVVMKNKPSSNAIRSVSEWRAAAMATGMAPSTDRCVPLQEPIPSKCWGTPEHAESIIIPDFHRLVNFPDYLIKNYPDYLKKNRSKKGVVDKDGMRHCVMCGQSRLCSASSGKLAPSTRVRTPKFANSVDGEADEETSASGTNHIIPRQNKGLCTACDITVWVITDSHIEIKWCKGCKNFRPWAAFGDKGMATKCVRCRDRQREKYASQKDKLRANRQNKKMSDKDDHHEMAAARGLRDLMSASMTAV